MTGLPIGNLTSQQFANHFMNPLDQLATSRRRVPAYLRYMDDLLLFDDDQRRLTEHCAAVEARCAELRLRLHPWEVRPTAAGLSFLGFRFAPDGTVRVKKQTVRRARAWLQRLKHDYDQCCAVYGPRGELTLAARDRLLRSTRASLAHFAHADSRRLSIQLLRELGLFFLDDDPNRAQAPTAGGRRKAGRAASPVV